MPEANQNKTQQQRNFPAHPLQVSTPNQANTNQLEGAEHVSTLESDKESLIHWTKKHRATTTDSNNINKQGNKQNDQNPISLLNTENNEERIEIYD